MPFPWLVFRDSKGHRVGFQNDRFSLYWQFEDGTEYEGFETLKSELLARFNDYAKAVMLAAGEAPRPIRAQCEYSNDFGAVSPLEVATATLLSGDHVIPPADRSIQYAFHITLPTVSEQDVDTVVEVNAATREGQNVMWLDSNAKASREDITATDLLNAAHEQLLQAFVSSSSSKQLDTWGMVR